MLEVRDAPPLSVPLRFFLTAPLFGIAGAIILLAHPDTALSSRWHPHALAVLHCFTAGLMLQAMIGALFQVLPVAAGSTVPRPRLLASLVHPVSAIGAALLVAGFLLPGHRLGAWGAALLAGACAVFLGALAPGLLRSRARDPARRLIRVACVGLALAVTLGLVLAYQLEQSASARFVAWVNLHALWALAGWALPLVAGVAVLIVPMFYMTPPYPGVLMSLAALALPVTLASISAALLSGAVDLARWLSLGASLFGLGFAGITLALFARRRRPRIDAAGRGWRLAMLALALASVLLMVSLVARSASGVGRFEIAFGSVLALGVFCTLIAAMLQKILPFLITLHLAASGRGARLQGGPGERALHLQITLQTGSVIALLLACFWPALAMAAGLVLLAAQAGLAWSVLAFALAYYRMPTDSRPLGRA